MFSSRRSMASSAAALVASALVVGGLAPPAGAADPRSVSTASKAVAFLATQQGDDGGFGSSEAFETPDVVLAIADAAQADLEPNPGAALRAVRAIHKNGRDGLGFLDDLADGGINAGKAAQLVLVAEAVGLDPSKFDPDGDGSADLLAVIDAAHTGTGSYGTFYATAQVVIALVAAGRTVPADTVDYLQQGQQPSGGYDFSGDPTASGDDVDTTGHVVQALAGAGVSPDQASIAKALARLAQIQNADGSWSAFGAPDPNSTAQAVLAVAAAGYDPVGSCWRTMHAASAAAGSPDDYVRKAQASDGHITSGADDFGISTFATSQAIEALLRTFQPVARAPRQACPTTGYRLVATDGGVFTHGDAGFFGSTGDLTLNQPIVTAAETPSGKGYWLFAGDGGVFSFGDAGFFGSTGATKLNQPIVAAAATPTGAGYWLIAADGGVFAFGDAPFLGSTGDLRLNKPIVGAAATPTGRGYWLFASDGGVFTFGDATFAGSTGDLKLNKPIVAAVASLPGRGYLLFASDGGVFTFGDASFHGSAGDLALNKPIVTGVRSGGTGYDLVASDGGVFAFGAPFFGSEGDKVLNKPIVAATP